MISHYLSSLTGVEYVGEAALILSLLTFLLVVIRAFRMDRTRIGHAERLPFDDTDGSGKEVTP